ncbi:hypothetical protein H6G17_29385 [Chroococcidiopsis sp. FACHB-1243]|uniref:hypothetical protein n=1 Tax=Chroococcidiopsis sp. [FACHB-1243] TaxID=2692781 RepID=UPI001785FD7F|nr:hypothetical protein [Chroococcidiopsis sp. [FACHB-1243]]MBD2309556.1 hypothetical protein [Chroococcidiopsis sp. [FACHB-1243]]
MDNPIVNSTDDAAKKLAIDDCVLVVNHALLSHQKGKITALPSPGTAIVALNSGERERISLKYLKPIQEEVTIGLGTNELAATEAQTPFDLDSEFLSPEEERQLHLLERKVERVTPTLVDAGKALQEIRTRRLFRGTHRNFEEYCQDRFGFTRRHVDYTIAAATVIENLRTNGSQILPTSERQVRDLLKLEPDEQCQVWHQALVASNGKVPSGRIVKGIVEQLKEKPLVFAKDYCQVGDVFTLVRLEGKEKKYNGCSCVAVEPRDFTIMVDVHDTTLTVKPENLNKIDSPEVHRQLPQILQRIRRVREFPGFRDRAAYAMLEHLGKQTYLTPLEDKLLQVIEREYGVEGVEREAKG